MTVAVSGDSITFPDNSVQNTAPTGFGFKNRIINGAMVIDQRNAGAVVTPASENVTFITDRFYFIRSITTSPTLQKSTDAPAGFTNSLLFTNASTGATPTYAQVVHNIEGFNTADLGWGTANAQTITVSFRVKSSLTGTFSVAFRNSANNRSYVTTYAISAANTWETKTVTIPGDTSGTWLTNNGIGISLIYRIGGSGGTSSTNQWTATSDAFASGSVNVMGTANATWQITGVQLEKGSTATSFDYRPYGTEWGLCQRYLPATFNRVGNDPIAVVQCISSTIGIATIPFPVTPRVNPTGITTTTASNFYVTNISANAGFNASAMAFELTSNLIGQIRVTYANNSASSGNIVALYSNTSGAQILWTGCEL